MKIKDQINNDLKDAMRNKDKVTLEALRAAKTAFTLAQTQSGATGEISDADELKIIQKLVKQRKDSAEIYKSQSRTDLYDREMAEAEVLEKYLPAKLSPEELKAKLQEIIIKVDASAPSDMGKVMGVATRELAGKADGKEIAEMVRKILAG